MYVWELIAHRLRSEGWTVWHRAHPGLDGPTFEIHLQRRDRSCRSRGPTLTEAFAEASRQARQVTTAEMTRRAVAS
jgi:hypothetical protein